MDYNESKKGKEADEALKTLKDLTKKMEQERLEKMDADNKALKNMRAQEGKIINDYYQSESYQQKSEDADITKKWLDEYDRMDRRREEQNEAISLRKREVRLEECKKILGFEQDFDEMDKAELNDELRKRMKSLILFIENNPQEKQSKEDQILSKMKSIMYVSGAVSIPAIHAIEYIAQEMEKNFPNQKIYIRESLSESINSSKGSKSEFSDMDKERIERSKRFLRQFK